MQTVNYLSTPFLYCFNLPFAMIQVLTTGLHESVLRTNVGTWTGWFSEEKRSWTSCPRNYFVYRINCKGRYCDNKRLQCAPMNNNAGITVESKFHYSSWFSEEQGPNSCPMDYYLVAMRCSGRYCDNLKFKCQKASRNSICNAHKS